MTTDAREMTAAQLEQVLVAAIKARDWQGVEAALILLAYRDPLRAAVLYDTLVLGLRIAQAQEETACEPR